MKRISLWLKFLATGSFTLLLSACYGVIMTLEKVHRSGSFVITDSNTGNPIEGIKVTYDGSYSSDYSNNSGIVNYNIDIESYSSSLEPITIYLSDVDGIANGSYPNLTNKDLDAESSPLYWT
ncbi:MAG: hypothetical protein JXA95_01735 [Spirochaetales bacterium]|nr:hypothetical protein [Spirochaetales bacterium]